ncbi:hypothetical protein A2645_00810 [Candidatus Nomurabacteria bacterium RIFCSPHIGHO2_01_FULL_39_9]|uniref:Small-conductance mechanosensitive ion channel n=1 Tax=Candidatus Nomurabacteria bacterium RIFCSPHIGHO2_01_FULL_39_9 TaxID=1801735 RepID=A0A1F6UW22_9BACT|nr:MAG: hypothetical protein A2645_00810 [Candidatus Nomurabacteria bacterium RIFCSPHIGHO2_01_FULL_39_9]
MFIQTWGEVFTSSLQSLWVGVAGFLPNLIIAIIIFIVGWIIGGVVGRAIEQGLSALKIDNLFRSIGTEELLARAGMKLNVGGFIGELIKWFIIVVFLITSFDVLGLSEVNAFLKDVVVSYLPKVIVAALILILASVISDVMQKFVEASARAAQMRGAKFAGSLARYAIWLFAFIIALSELGIAPAFMQILFTGVVATLTIAAGLSFGLGGKDMATRSLEKLGEQVKQ